MPTYDVVAHGADPTGRTAIDPVLDDLVGSDTTIVCPEGTYGLESLRVPEGMDDLRLVAPAGARLVPATSGARARLLDVYGDGFVLDGFELEMRGLSVPPDVRMRPVAGDWELRRLVTRGKVRAETDTSVGSSDPSDARTYFSLSAAAGTRGLLQDCYFHEGACASTEASNRRAILVESSKGELLFNRCWFELWGENTIYAKKPAGKLRIYNCFVRNTNNGLRLGGNTEVRNCVSVKDDRHPRSAWSNGSIQRGVVAEAIDPADESAGINSYDGTLTIADSDFSHRLEDNSSRPPIAGPKPCRRIEIRNVRVSYDSSRSADAVYTAEGTMTDGTPANLEYLRLEDVHVRNDNEHAYGVSIGQEPDRWGPVSGVIGGTGPGTDSPRVRSRMTVGGDPDEPDTTPPLPAPPSPGTVPLQSAQLVRIDNADNAVPSGYAITAGTHVLPAGDDGASVAMTWGPDDDPRRPPNSTRATGTVPAGEVHAFYVTGGIVATEAAGPATWTIDGSPADPEPGEAGKLSTSGRDDDWHTAGLSKSYADPVVAMKPLSHGGSDPAHVRLRDVDEEVAFRIEEWEYLDGSHTREETGVAAFDAGITELDGDGRVEAGQVETDETFTSVDFEAAFDRRPVVLAQPQTDDGPQPIVSRQRNASAEGTAVRVQEEEGANGIHRTETVGYLAVEPGTDSLNGSPLEAGHVDGVTDAWEYIPFDRSYVSPQFLADIETYNGADPCELRYRNLTATGVEVKVEEERSADRETDHVAERVGYLVVEGDPYAPANGEVKRVSASGRDGARPSVDLSKSYADPVVVMKPLSHGGSDPAHVRLRDVDEEVAFRIEEWEYLDGSHTREETGVAAFDAGATTLTGGTPVEAGRVETDETFTPVDFEAAFDRRPVVLAQPQTDDGPQPIVSRQRNASAEGTAVRVQEEEGANGIHRTETVGYLAVEPGTDSLNGSPLEAGHVDGVTDAWHRVSFDRSYASPRFLADIETYNGADPCELRYRNLTATGVEVKVEEERSADRETDHVAERVGYLVVEGG